MTISPNSPSFNYNFNSIPPHSPVSHKSHCRKAGKRLAKEYPTTNKMRRIVENLLEQNTTAHKVEVNHSFQETHPPDNMVESSQKISTPQLYEQLQQDNFAAFEKIIDLDPTSIQLLSTLAETSPNFTIDQTEQDNSYLAFLSGKAINSPQLQGQKTLNPTSNITSDTPQFSYELPIPEMIDEDAFYNLLEKDLHKTRQYFLLAWSQPEGSKLPSLWINVFAAHATKNPLKMIEFINETLPELSKMFPEKLADPIRNKFIQLGNHFIYICMTDPKFSSEIKNWSSQDWGEICQLLESIYPSWDYPFLILKWLAEKAPLPLEVKDDKSIYSLTAGLYARCIMEGVYGRPPTNINFQEISSHLDARGYQDIRLMLMGWAYHNQGKLKLAARAFEEARELSPYFLPSLRGLASTWFKDKSHCMALKILHPLIAIHDRLGSKIRADLFRECKDYRRAIYDYTVNITDNINPEVLFARGICHYNLRDYKMAISDFTKLLDDDPKNPDAICYLAACMEGLGYIDRALDMWRENLAKTPRHVNTLRMRAALWMRKEDFQKAASDYTVILNPLLTRFENWRKSITKLSQTEIALLKELLPLRMECNWKLNQRGPAAQDADKILGYDERNMNALKVRLAFSWGVSNKNSQSYQESAKAVAEMRCFAAQNMPVEALEKAHSLLKTYPNFVEAKNVIREFQLQRGNIDSILGIMPPLHQTPPRAKKVNAKDDASTKPRA